MLPVELLAHIFTFYHAEAPDKSSLPYPSWLPITHVCRRWRTVALGHGQLWASVTRGLPSHWIKAFMERSGTMLMDFDIHVAPGYRDCLHIVPLLANFTRVRSLCLTGSRNSIPPVIDSLRSSLPVRSLSLCLEDKIVPSRAILILPDNLFGRDAPIRYLQLVVIGFNGGHIVTPHWLLRSVTHFMTAGPTLTELLDTLHHMSALVYLEFQSHASCYIAWFTPTVVPVQMPHLMNLVVRTRSPFEFMLLHRLLLPHPSAKTRLELGPGDECSHTYASGIKRLSLGIEASNVFRHIHFSGVRENLIFRLWTGDVGTTWEDAKFCVFVKTNEYGYSRENFIRLCDGLGAARVRRLVIDSLTPALQMSFWWGALAKLRGIEELQLYPASVEILGDAWGINFAPAVFPALRRVGIMDSELNHPSAQYAIFRAGKHQPRRIVRLLSSTESAEMERRTCQRGF